VLNETLFGSLDHALVLTEWRLDYNTIRPHSSLDNLPPAHYAKLSASASQRDGSLRAIGGYAPRPVATQAQMANRLYSSLDDNRGSGHGEYYVVSGKMEVRGGVENRGITAIGGDYGS
jgi:hypothetical protein